MGICKSTHVRARSGTCQGFEGHDGNHWAWDKVPPGYKFVWSNPEKMIVMMDDDTVKLAALALFYRHAKRGENWDSESKARQEEILADARCVLEAATGFGKVRND